MRGLVTGRDGRDRLVRTPEWAGCPAGGVLDLETDITTLPFGVVELVVVRGVGAGIVHRLDIGRYRCGPGDVDVPLPARGVFTLDVACGGTVVVDGDPWPVGTPRQVHGLDLDLRWVTGPASRAVPGSSAVRPLPDLLLDVIAGVRTPDAPPSWEFGRVGDRVWTSPVAERPFVVVTGSHRHAYVRGLLGRLVAGCMPESLRLTVLAPGRAGAAREEWAWTRWAPHARHSADTLARVGFDEATCARLVSEVARRGEDATGLDLVVVDGHVGAIDSMVRPGFAVLVLTERPVEAGTRVEVSGPVARMRDVDGTTTELTADLPEVEWIDRLARATTTLDEEPATPGRLVDLVGADPTSDADVTAAWAGPLTTRVVIGESPDGDLVSVDLRADGPHALIGGTTGSGKSELLQTLVTSLALANPPSAMTFLLVDYKGGAAFAPCSGLPHVLGVVTDLDAALTERALASLSAEVRRRERLLADAGAVDLDTYLATGHGPLARLVIVVDEFATLAAELPDFVDGVVDIARRGRSLGLHLVLATQRPAGAVSADIRANTTLRIALRVAETADSVDVIGLPDAVDIDERRPGRAFIRVGQNPPVEVQTSRVTTAPTPSGVVGYEFGTGPVGSTAADPALTGRTDLELLADTMTRVVDATDVPVPPSPWLPPLPEDLSLDDCVLPPDCGRWVPFGWEDRPAEQTQAVATLDLAGMPLAVVGTARSGRSATLLTLAHAVAREFTPAEVHVHAIDAGARGLVGLDEHPHVGVVADRDDPDRIDRLVARLVTELDHRVQTLARQRLRDVGELQRSDQGSPWPHVLLLVDRWDLLSDRAEVVDDRILMVGLERLVTDGPRVGITVVATGDRTLLTGRMVSLFPDRLVLRLADPYDYTSLALPGPAGRGAVGRGWRGPDGVETQVAHVSEHARLGSDDVPLPSGGPFRIDPMPSLVTRAEADALPHREAASPASLLVAVGGDELAARSIDADEFGPSVLVTGRRRSGRSGVLLTLVESARRLGWRVVVVLGRRSPLEAVCTADPAIDGPYRRDGDASALTAAVRSGVDAGDRMLVVADDIDLLPDGDLVEALAELPTMLRDTGGLFVGAAEPEEVVAAFRGPVLALRRARCGVMLSPQGTEDGEAFGVRLRRGQYGRSLPTGAGYLVLDGLPERVQVVQSDLTPDT